MNENSYVKLHRQTVKELCLTKLAIIKTEEEVRWNEAIEAFKKCRQWFKSIGFFWLNMELSYEEWKKEIVNKTFLIDFKPHLYFWGEDTCYSLLKAAKDDNIDDLMYLCIDDYHDITRDLA